MYGYSVSFVSCRPLARRGWNDVCVGESLGWIPVLTTLGGTDCADSGHIRLGERCSNEPVSVEAIDYALERSPSDDDRFTARTSQTPPDGLGDFPHKYRLRRVVEFLPGTTILFAKARYAACSIDGSNGRGLANALHRQAHFLKIAKRA